MKKIAIVMFFMVLGLNAAVLPMVPTTEVVIKKGQFSTISFPFNISHVEKSPFVSLAATIPADASPDAVINSEVLLNAEHLPQPGKKGAKRPTVAKSISMKKSKRSLSIFPKKIGSTELVVYGYSKYPLHVKIIVRKNASADHFSFKNFETRDIKEADKFEMVSHEKVISKLLKYAFNNQLPKGYRKVHVSKTYNRSGMRFKLNKKLVGDRYQVNEWILKNTKKGKVTLYEEMFYVDGIYSIAFENNVLNTGESTRMFIVRKSKRI